MEYRIDSIITDGKFGGFLLKLTDGGVNYNLKVNLKFQTKSAAIAYAHSVNPHANQSSQAA